MIKCTRRNFLGSIAASLAMALTPAFLSSTVQASEEPIRIIVPYGAGGLTDTYARILAEGMTDDLGRQVLVENKPGANGIIGSTFVANAEPDGTTLLMGGTGPVSLNSMLRPNLAYGFESFEPVAMLYSGPLTITVPTAINVESIEGLVSYAKQSSSPVRYGTLGPGSVTDLFGRMLVDRLEIEGVGVAYKNNPASLIDLIAGQTELSFSAPTSVLEHQEAGDVRILALTIEERDPRYPEIPTVAELGYPELVVSFWGGFLAPKGTPKDLVDEIAEAAVNAAQSEKFKSRVENRGLILSAGDADAMASQLEADRQAWGPVIEKNNIVLN